MIVDLSTIAEFSRVNCAAICAFLVPANLLATLQTLIFTGLKFSQLRVQLIVGFASFYAILMLLHVYSWFSIGVVMMPTYILLFLGGFCLSLNAWAIAHPASLSSLLQILAGTVIDWGRRRRKKSYDLGV
ncbi:MAG: hypothetical protein SWJ54_23570 [Cyanobacteriota bacterium]|nr:hypothetical protein [Cyanobacteriota bacterium]